MSLRFCYLLVYFYILKTLSSTMMVSLISCLLKIKKKKQCIFPFTQIVIILDDVILFCIWIFPSVVLSIQSEYLLFSISYRKDLLVIYLKIYFIFLIEGILTDYWILNNSIQPLKSYILLFLLRSQLSLHPYYLRVMFLSLIVTVRFLFYILLLAVLLWYA